MADFEVVRGSDAVLDLPIANELGEPVLLDGDAVVRFTAKRRYSDAEAVIFKSSVNVGEVIFDDDTPGTCHIMITPADTAMLAFYRQVFVYDAVLTKVGVRSVVARGSFAVLPAVTEVAES